jgi:hypothetical protein
MELAVILIIPLGDNVYHAPFICFEGTEKGFLCPTGDDKPAKMKKGRVNTHPFHLTKPIKLIKPKPMN